MMLRVAVTDPQFTPERQHPGDAGLDLKTTSAICLQPGDIVTVKTGVRAEIPYGFVGLACARSGNAFKHGIGLVNGVGVIDAGYRGEIAVALVNHGQETFEAPIGARIAQLVLIPVVLPDVSMVEQLDSSERGQGGFGSTGR